MVGPPAATYLHYMSTLNPTRKVSRRQELREDKVVTFYAKALTIYENQRNLVYGVIGGIVLLAVLIVGYSLYQANRNSEALEAMTTAVQRYEAGQYQAALDGDASFMGLLDVEAEYGSTETGNLARYYTADALFRVGEFERALDMFESYDKKADYLGASAFAGEAAIHELQENYKRAGDLFVRAATVYPNENTSPQYLLNAGRAYAAGGLTEDARRAYERLEDEYPNTQAATMVDYHIARLTAGS